MAIGATNPLPAAFPWTEVEAALDDWWEAEQQDAALPGDVPVVPDIMTPSIEIDSHRAVRALIVLQEIVKFEIKENVIKKGGYEDFADMRADIVPRIKALFEEKRKKQNA